MSSWDIQIGAYLLEVRTLRKLSRESLVARTGLHSTTIRRIETGDQQIKVEPLHRICTALGLKASEIIASIEDGEELPSALPGQHAAIPVHSVVVDGQMYAPVEDGDLGDG